MPSNRPSLAAQRRDVTGKAVARLRRDGRLPAVVYGRGVPSENVSVDTHEFEVLRRHTGANALVDLAVEGGRARPVLVHGVQVDRVTRRPLHVDLFVVRMTEELTVDVALHATGVAPAADKLGGTLIHGLEHVRVRALPGNIPEAIEYAVDGLADFDAAVHVRDLVVPEGATVLNDPDELVAKIERPRVEAVEAPEAEAVEEGAEPEAGEGAGPSAEAAATGEESEAG
ncbi:MAG TPA: 50S ribosomal protein L25 [Candidatus Limnocylindrales bacterium]|nr:50S ribosomal protein L25 [Candidatus Limnocylindrales bacterium]